MYRIADENPFRDGTPAAREMMRKAFPAASAETFFDAQDEAYRRSFINSCIVSAVYGPAGEFIGRCLDGHWTPACDF